MPHIRLLSLWFLLALSACARSDSAWEEARQLDTPDGYASYQERHPRSAHATEARVRREALLAERDWSVARNTDTVEAYGEYLEKHPEGLWAGKAKARVTTFSATPAAGVDAAPVEATPAPPAESTPASPAEATPASPAAVAQSVADAAAVPAAQKTPEPPPAPKVFVQLGAFSSAEGAQKAWRELQSRHAVLRDLQPAYRRSGKGATGLHLLKAGVTTRADAEKLCRTLQAAGQACLIS